MKTAVIKNSDLSRCPKLIMHPAHWMPEHRTEDCHDDLRALMVKKTVEIGGRFDAALKELRAGRLREIEDYARTLRRTKGGR